MKIYTKNESRKLKLNEKNIIINPIEEINTILADSITLSNSTINVSKKEPTVQLTVSLSPVEANENIIWTSSDPSIISVNNKGLLTLVGSSGSVTITATTEKSNLSATCKASIYIYPESIKISTNSIEINTNYSGKITASIYPTNANNKEIRWRSSNTDIVTVSNGTIKGISEGTAIITAQSKDNESLIESCEVIVTESVLEELMLSKNEMSLYENMSESISVQMTPSKVSYKAYEWIVSDPSIVEVTDMGAVFGLSTGETLVTCRHLRTGKTATCKVAVNSIPDNIIQTNNVASLKTMSLSVGDIVQTSCYSKENDCGEALYLIQTYDYWLNNWLPIDARRMSTTYDKLGVNLLLTDSVVDEYGNHTLDNGLIACLLNRLDIKVEQYGCIGDGVADNSEQFIHLFGQNKHGKITFGLNKTYMFPERSSENRDTTIFKAVANPYAAYSAGRSSTCERIVIANVNGLEIDGNGSTIKIPDGQWKVKESTQDFGTFNLFRVIRNLKIHDLTLDNSGLTMGYDTLGVENHGIAWKTGNESCNDGTTPIACDGTIHELSNFEVYNCTFKDLGTAKAINDCGGDAILIINPMENSHDIHIHDNKIYNWGRWVFAIDLGGDGECIENVTFNNNECIQYEDNVNLGGKFRGLGWIDFEARKCFKNLEVCNNYIKGCNGWAFNGNNKISENITVKKNTVIRTFYGIQPAGVYPYMCEWYSVNVKNLIFEDNDFSKCVAGNRLGISLKDAVIKNNIFPATSSATSIRRPLGNIIIDNNTAGDSGIGFGFSYYSYPDYYTEEDILNEKTHIEFTNNSFGISGNFISQKRYNSKTDLIIEGNSMGKMDVSYFGSKWTFNTNQLREGLGNHPFAARGATFMGFAPYNYRYAPNGGGLWKEGDIISQNDTRITTCTKSGYTQVQGELKYCEGDGYWSAEASKDPAYYFISNNKLYVTLNKGIFGTKSPSHTNGVETNGTISVLYLADIAEYSTAMKS